MRGRPRISFSSSHGRAVPIVAFFMIEWLPRTPGQARQVLAQRLCLPFARYLEEEIYVNLTAPGAPANSGISLNLLKPQICRRRRPELRFAPREHGRAPPIDTPNAVRWFVYWVFLFHRRDKTMVMIAQLVMGRRVLVVVQRVGQNESLTCGPRTPLPGLSGAQGYAPRPDRH